MHRGNSLNAVGTLFGKDFQSTPLAKVEKDKVLAKALAITHKAKDSSSNGCQASGYYKKGEYKTGSFFLKGPFCHARIGADRAEEITCTTRAINCKEGGYSVASKVVTPDSHALSSTNQLSLLKARTYTNDNNFSFTHPRRSRFEPPSSIRAQRSSCGRLRSPFYAKLVMDHPRP